MNIIPNVTDIKIQLPFNFRFFFFLSLVSTLFVVRFRVDISGKIRSLAMNTLQSDDCEYVPL